MAMKSLGKILTNPVLQKDIFKEKEDLITFISGTTPALKYIIKNWKLDEEFGRQVYTVQNASIWAQPAFKDTLHCKV